MKALLFLNGIPPKTLPNLANYVLITCTDGAFHFLKELNFPLEKLDFISGDFDSHSHQDDILKQVQHCNIEVMFTPDQNKTDFEKNLEILIEKGVTKVDIYGGSGGEMDHFLGNLTVAFLFKNQLEISFFDDYSRYFFAPKNLILNDVKGKMISLYPFPIAENVNTKGLKWSLNNENLNQTKRIGTRNIAEEETVSIEFESGHLVVFVSNLI